jgi:DNA-binding protein YbaB
MFNPLKGLGDIQKLQKMQQALQREEVTVEKNGVTVRMRGDQKVLAVSVDGSDEPRIVEAINEAVKKTQESAAKTLMSMSQE